MTAAAHQVFCRHCLGLLPSDWKGDRDEMYCEACREFAVPVSELPAPAPLEPIATCPACGETTTKPLSGRFFFECRACKRLVERLDGSAGSVRTGLKTRRVAVTVTSSMLTIVYRWHRLPGIAMSLGGMLSILGFVFSLHRESMDVVSLIAKLAMLLIGTALFYSGVANVLNRTEIVGRDGSLEVHSRPVRWREDRTLRLSEIRRVYTELIWRRHSDQGWRLKTYDVEAELKNGERVRLFSWMYRREDAFAASHALRSWIETHDPKNW